VSSRRSAGAAAAVEGLLVRVLELRVHVQAVEGDVPVLCHEARLLKEPGIGSRAGAAAEERQETGDREQQRYIRLNMEIIALGIHATAG
jgi:hypothetical protein